MNKMFKADEMRKKTVYLLAFPLLLLLLFGCITSHLKTEQPIRISRLNIVVSNFSELLALDVPLQCAANTDNGTAIVLIKNRSFRADMGGYAVMKQDGLLYMHVPDSRRAELNCEWIMVNQSDDVFAQLSEFDPFNQSLESLPSSSFACDAAYIPDSEFYPSGKVCWFLDIK